MLSIVLTLSWIGSQPLFASQANAMTPSPNPVDQPAYEAGTLWDYVEQIEGAIPTGQPIPQSAELEEERNTESSYIQQAVGVPKIPTAFYTDPVGTLAADPLHLSEVDPTEFDIPVVINEDVIRWMKYFTGPGRKYYTRWLARSTRVQPLMIEKLDAAGLPRDLVYLSMIESGYLSHAYSRAAAVGLWQFISSTGKEYDLRIDWWVDERRDPEAATDAAIDFLGHLHRKYGHWYLAWAAYNGGPSRVSRGIRQHGTKDFWTLVDKNAFPRETDNYVPKLIAAAIIGKHPERYGFTNITYQDPIAVERVEVGPSIGLDVLAKCAGITQEEFQALNPQLRRWALPPEPAKQTITIPKNKRKSFVAALDKVPPQERLTFRRHHVQKGETLGRIAQKYGVSATELQRLNRIDNANRIYVGMELVIPVPGTSNGEASFASSAGSGPKQPRAKAVTHVVRSGESLTKIASRYGVTQQDLMRWNQISNPNRIQVGQKLRLVEPATNWTSYTVRKGDNLTRIATQHSCTVEEIKSWNHLRNSNIYPGQKLKLHK